MRRVARVGRMVMWRGMVERMAHLGVGGLIDIFDIARRMRAVFDVFDSAGY